jgi:hypothetical protein
MKGNFHVRFFGGRGRVTARTYPAIRQGVADGFAQVRLMKAGDGIATVRAKRSPGEEEAERQKLPNRTQWVNWNPTRERMAKPRKRVLRRRQRWRHEA